jgi:hypothetical protein
MGDDPVFDIRHQCQSGPSLGCQECGKVCHLFGNRNTVTARKHSGISKCSRAASAFLQAAQVSIEVFPVSDEGWTVKLVHSKWTFLVLQAMDVMTTLAAFRVGAFEFNPLVARFTHELGPVGGLIVSKTIALLIVLGVRRLVWVANVFYSLVVLWNIYVLFTLSALHR